TRGGSLQKAASPDQSAGRNKGGDLNVLAWTGVHAVQAERAVEIAGLGRLEQPQFAAAMLLIAAQAIMRLAGIAYGAILYRHLQWRDQRVHEMELPDGADVLAEARALKQAIENRRR